MSATAEPAGGIGALPARAVLEGLGRALLALAIFTSCVTFLRPAPYDLLILATMGLWLALGARLHRGTLAFVGLLLLYNLGLFLALQPHWDEPLPVEWTIQSLYLAVTGLFFAMLFADDTARRVEVALNAYIASCLMAAVAGAASYFELSPGLLFRMDGRAAGVFEDPNVLGSFLILGALALGHRLVTGRTRRPVLSLAALTVIVLGIFLSFSRGSWAALVVATVVSMGLTFLTTTSRRIRRRIAGAAAAALVSGALGLAALLSVDSIAERFADRATVSKDYDEGETGRFGNQRRSIPLLLEQPNGMGPLRFRRSFDLEPHNSYIGSFANGGWLGGLAFLGLVLATGFVGFRLCLTPSPVHVYALMIWPALFVFFLQALQIDIEKWRHVYILLGLVWGLEAARLRSAARAGPPSPAG